MQFKLASMNSSEGMGGSAYKPPYKCNDFPEAMFRFIHLLIAALLLRAQAAAGGDYISRSEWTEGPETRDCSCSHVTESCAPQNQKLKRNFLSPSQLLDSEQDRVAKP